MFHNIVFDEQISYGSRGGPAFSTTVAVSNSGYEQRNANWDIPLKTWDVSHIIDTRDKITYLISFFNARKGKANTFLFKDWSDYSAQLTDDGEEGYLLSTGVSTYQMQKKYYDSGSNSFRNIIKPKQTTVTVYNGSTLLTEGVHYSIDYTTGILTKLSGTVTHWRGEFYIVVRFDTDSMNITLDGPHFGNWNGIPITEVRM